MTNGKSIKEILQKGINLLKNSGIENANLDARAFLRHILGKESIYLDIHKEDILDDIIIDLYMNYIKRRCNNEPFAYIVNTKEFMSLDFYVDKNVLIPRPDTEILVEYIINYCKNIKHNINIIDLCTGSGAIAVSLASYIPNCTVTAIDISESALEIAQKNAHTHNVNERILFKKYDVLSDISKLGKFDIIVSNPPYISKNDISSLDTTVKDFEPILALDGGYDGLLFYRNIIKYAPKTLKSGGIIACEIGYNQAESVTELLKSEFQGINVLKDYSGNDRVATANLR